MSEAVKFAWSILKKMHTEKMVDLAYIESISKFVDALQIRQGDYRIADMKYEGLMVEYTRLSKDQPFVHTSEILKKRREGNYTKLMMEYLTNALGEKYEVRIRNIGEEIMKEIKQDELFKTSEDKNIGIVGAEIFELFPLYEIYLHGEMLGTLFESYFTFDPENPRAIFVMERIGSRIFECRKGKVEFGYVGVRNLDKWRRELLK